MKVTKQESELEIDMISGFVTCSYDREWWLACVLEVDAENLEVKVSFLHPCGPTSILLMLTLSADCITSLTVLSLYQLLKNDYYAE